MCVLRILIHDVSASNGLSFENYSLIASINVILFPRVKDIPVNRGAEKGIGKLSKKITEGGLRGGVPGLETTHNEKCRCRRELF